MSRGGVRRVAIVLFYALLGLALLAPSASDVATPSASDIPPHLGTIVQARMALEEGQFPLRVAPWQHNGFRYPEWQFYSPLPYTVAAPLYMWVTPSNPYAAYKLTLWLALVVAGTFTYCLARWLTGSRPAALLAGAAYMAAPYFLINVHARGAFPEAVAQGIMPAALYFSLRSYVVPGPRHVLAGGVAWAALALAHTITFVYGSLFAGLWLLLSLGGHPKKAARRLGRLGAAYGLGWLLALYFMAPVMAADYLRIRDDLRNPSVESWYTPLPALLSPVSVAPEPQFARPIGRFLHPAVGWPLLAGAGTLIYTLAAQPSALRRGGARRLVPGLLAVFGLALFMTWSPFDFWAWLPKGFHLAQYTYRLLTHVMWAGALLLAYALVVLFKGGLDSRHVVVGLLTLGIASSSWLPTLPRGVIPIADTIRTPDLGYGQFDYLVKTVTIASDDVPANVELPVVFPDGWLMLGVGVDLGPLVRSEAASGWSHVPSLRLVGAAPTEGFVWPMTLSALLNGDVLGTIELNGGRFRWDVPLDPLTQLPDGAPAELQIVSDKIFRPMDYNKAVIDLRELAVRADSVTITGLPPERSALPVAQTGPRCHLTGSATACSVTVLPEAGLVQLPVLFYPGLLDVRVNGRRAPYVPLVHRSYVLTGLELPPGAHEIRVSFEGLAWANWVSGIAWLGVIAALAATSVRMPAPRRWAVPPRRERAYREPSASPR